MKTNKREGQRSKTGRGESTQAGRGLQLCRDRYLLQATVLDVQLLGTDEVEELPVLLPAGERGEGQGQSLGQRTLTRTHLSMLLKVYCVPCLVSISKSKERVVVVPRAKLTKLISSKRMCTGGLCT